MTSPADEVGVADARDSFAFDNGISRDSFAAIPFRVTLRAPYLARIVSHFAIEERSPSVLRASRPPALPDPSSNHNAPLAEIFLLLV